MITQSTSQPTTVPVTSTTTPECAFDCGNGECLPDENMHCDGKVQCGNGRDEAECVYCKSKSAVVDDFVKRLPLVVKHCAPKFHFL